MSDIVEQLRAREIVTEPGEPFTMLTVRPWFTENLLLREDAADEIQRLRIESARWKENNKAGWVALGLIRDALTEWCIPGTLDSEEYADGPTQQHAAEQLIAAISSLREQLDAANTESHESTEIIGELRAERDRLREGIRKARIEISGGLCYFTAEAKHLQLADADRTLAALSETGKPND